jgi:hypothetical protein
MPKYQRKPPVFDALQFTGGQANAKAIVEGVNATSKGRFQARYLPAASEFGIQNGAVAEFKKTEQIKIIGIANTSADQYANVGDWVLVDRDGLVSVLTDAAFTEQFVAVT